MALKKLVLLRSGGQKMCNFSQKKDLCFSDLLLISFSSFIELKFGKKRHIIRHISEIEGSSSINRNFKWARVRIFEGKGGRKTRGLATL